MFAGFAGADANGVVQIGDKDFAIADLPGSGHFGDNVCDLRSGIVVEPRFQF